MSYAVLVHELRAAAGEYETIANSLGATPVVVDHVEPDSLGHVELAAWLVAVADQCGNAHTALHDGMGTLSVGLRAAATDYETTDDQVGGSFASPFPGPGFAAPAPFGPPVPGAGPR